MSKSKISRIFKKAAVEKLMEVMKKNEGYYNHSSAYHMNEKYFYDECSIQDIRRTTRLIENESSMMRQIEQDFKDFGAPVFSIKKDLFPVMSESIMYTKEEGLIEIKKEGLKPKRKNKK